jgi:hypothetical protein
MTKVEVRKSLESLNLSLMDKENCHNKPALKHKKPNVKPVDSIFNEWSPHHKCQGDTDAVPGTPQFAKQQESFSIFDKAITNSYLGSQAQLSRQPPRQTLSQLLNTSATAGV